jgi:hypothetical protein
LTIGPVYSYTKLISAEKNKKIQQLKVAMIDDLLLDDLVDSEPDGSYPTKMGGHSKQGTFLLCDFNVVYIFDAD